jgi:hypothetical protein
LLLSVSKEIIQLNEIVKQFKNKQKTVAQIGNNCYHLNCCRARNKSPRLTYQINCFSSGLIYFFLPISKLRKLEENSLNVKENLYQEEAFTGRSVAAAFSKNLNRKIKKDNRRV